MSQFNSSCTASTNIGDPNGTFLHPFSRPLEIATFEPETVDWARATERSVDDVEEASSQRRGFASAIRDPEVIKAIQFGRPGSMARRWPADDP